MEIKGCKLILQLAILIFTISTPSVFGKSLKTVTSPRAYIDEDASLTDLPEINTKNAFTGNVDLQRDSDENDAILDEVVINEICEEDVFKDVSDPSRQNKTISDSKITRKEKLLCAILKMEAKRINRTKPKPAVDIKETVEEFYLPKNYNKKAAPLISVGVKAANGTEINIQVPVQLYAFLNIRSIRDMDEDKEEVTLYMDMILLWVDGEILKKIQERNVTVDKIDSKESDEDTRPIPPELADKIWMPDVIFDEVVQVNRPVVLEKGTKVYFNPKLGALVIVSRFFVNLICNMNLFYYPADTQRCPFNLRSGYHTTKELNMKWWNKRGNGVYLQETSDPNFDARVTSVSQIDQYNNLGPASRLRRNSSYLKFEIHIRRKMSYHLVQTYLPSVFFIIVTWICFLIPSKMLEVRIAVTMTTLLTLTSMFSSVRENTTVVSYVKAIDIWMVTCIFFIFTVLFAFAFEAWIRAARKRLQAQKDALNQDETVKFISKTHRILHAYNAIEGYIESYAALALFSSFLVFNITYWCWLLIGAEYLNWDVDEQFNNVTN